MAQELPPIPKVEYNASTSENIILAYAVRYGINGKEFLAVAKCESGLRATAINKADPNGGSKGVYQFQPATFAGFSKEAGIINADVWNPFHNIETAAYMFSKGEKGKRHWSCWQKLFGGKSPPH